MKYEVGDIVRYTGFNSNAESKIIETGYDSVTGEEMVKIEFLEDPKYPRSEGVGGTWYTSLDNIEAAYKSNMNELRQTE